MLVLALDTSTPTVTAGVVRVQDGVGSGSGRVLSEHTVTDRFAHAERLMPLVCDSLVECGHRLADVDAVVVGLGPGPFTGLRVGVATAQALGDALGIAVHGVPSHDAVARQVGLGGDCGDDDRGDDDCGDDDFLVVTDARRREVYLSAYTASLARASVARVTIARVYGPAVVAPAGIPALLAANGLHPGWVSGAGAHLVAAELGLHIRASAGPLSGWLVECATALMGGAAPGVLTPLYLRRPDATEPGRRKSVLGPAASG